VCYLQILLAAVRHGCLGLHLPAGFFTGLV
jgi:hypothetical protein